MRALQAYPALWYWPLAYSFEAGSIQTARVRVRNPSAQSLSYSAELYLGKYEGDKAAKATQSFSLAAGEEKDIDFRVTMPSTPVTYHVYLDVYVEGERIAAYIATEDVTVTPPLYSLWGIITDAETGNSIEGISVNLNGLRAITGTNGRYDFYNLESGTYWMSVTDPFDRYEPNPNVVPDGIPIPETKTLDIQLVPLPVGPIIPEPFEATFIPLCIASYRFWGIRAAWGEGLAESLLEVPGYEADWAAYMNTIAASYVAKYKPTGLIAGPQYFYKPYEEAGETVHGYDLFGHEFEGRVKYPATPQSGIKVIIPALEGKSWTCYLDVNGPYALSSDWFANAMKVNGSGSLIRFRGPADPRKLEGAGMVGMLRIEFDDERWIVTCPLLLRHWTGVGYSIGYALNFEWELADLLTENKLAHFKYGSCRSKLIELYNKYTGTLEPVYTPDKEDAIEAGNMLLDKGWPHWYSPIHDGWVEWTLDEVEAAYNTKISAADAYYAEMTAFYEGLRAKYEKNWTDP